MDSQQVRLIDMNRNVVAQGEVKNEGNHFGGTIDLGAMPHLIQSLFAEFEEIVNGQMFTLLDVVQEAIENLDLTVIFRGGHETFIKDLQIYPSTGEFSFRVPQLHSRPEAAPPPVHQTQSVVIHQPVRG